ncbi:MAG: phosphatase family protein [Thermoleophilia bacterium]|nr:phosphatase family protein [Thermoleophilia bacterium]
MRLSLVSVPAAVLQVPAWLQSSFDDAVAAGTAEAASWSASRPAGTAQQFDRDTLASVTAPPAGAAQQAELAQLHALEARRTTAGTERAVALARWAGTDTWRDAVREIGATQGADQARRAERLLRRAGERVGKVTNDAKDAFSRLRPYELDPTLTTVVSRPPGNASHPSGHSSGSYAAALVLAAFLPARAAELVALADEVAFSRLYGGVHFTSDVVVGARIAARIAADVLRRDAAMNALAAA